MYVLDVSNKLARSIQLSQNSKYEIISITGLTPPKANINYSAIGDGDGNTYNSSRLDTRNITISIKVNFPVEENRIELYSIFRPKECLTFHYKNGSRDVIIDGYVESIEGNLFTNNQIISVSIICLQPYFKDVEQIVNDLSTTLDMFEFPFSTEDEGVIFSELNQSMETIVTNVGEVETGLIIELYAIGIVRNPIIYDGSNNSSIGLSFTMQSGDLIRINTNRSEKSISLIRDGVESNIINYLNGKPTWFALSPGETVFAYNADSGVDFLQIKFKHHDLFAGV